MVSSLNKITKTPTSKVVGQYILIVVGIMMYCFAWSVFLIPKHIIGGGVVGLASVVYIITGIPVGISNFVFNFILLAIGFKILGSKFGINTIVGIIASSLSFILLQQVIGIQNLIDSSKFDPFMSTIIGAMMSGVGIGFCFTSGGNSGGSDIIALIVTKYYNVNPGRIISIVDALVILSSLIIPGNGFESIVYGFVVLGVYTYTIDFVIEGRKQSYQITVFSQKNDEIADAIGNEVKRGVTLLNGWGWYSKKDQKVLLVIAQRTDKVAIMRLIKSIDPQAFISVSKTEGVFGKNFDTLKK
jgi:uncharacterized membrane-anchored protein YitT (DUF2179 family)